MKSRKIFVLNPSQSKRIIAKGVANLPQIKDALKSGKIFVCRGSTNAYVLEELYKEAGIDTKFNKADFVSGQIIPGKKFMKWWINPRSDKKIAERWLLGEDLDEDELDILGINSVIEEANWNLFVW